MAWLTGLLTGYADERRRIEQQNMELAAQAAEREGEIYKALLNSPNPEIAAMAGTGILQLGQPRKRKGGFAGWMGEMQTSPIYPELLKHANTPAWTDVEVPLPRQPSVPPSGAIEQPPAQAGAAALPDTQTTTAGAPPPAAPVAPATFEEVETPGTQNLAPPPPPQFTGAAEKPWTLPPPAPPTLPTSTIQRRRAPRAFQTAEEAQLSTRRGYARGDVAGEIAGYTEMFQAADPSLTPEQAAQKAAALVSATKMRTSGQTAGMYMINAARARGFASPEEAYARGGPAVYQQIIDEAETLRRDAAYATRMGSGQGAFDSPTTLSGSALTGAPVGSSSGDYAGRRVPTAAERTRRHSAELLRGQLQGIRELVSKTLPSEKDLVGLAPNAANAVRSRMSGERRNQYARLNAEIDQIVAALSRSIGENRGAQTEQDAVRAYNTIADARGSLTDPLGGDTAESAMQRIDTTLTYLERILAQVPGPLAPPQPGTPPPSPAAAQPGGVTLDSPLPPGLLERIDPVTGEFRQ